MPPKRKNREEATVEETAPKKTLRQQREAARILAKEWSEKRKIGNKSPAVAKPSPAVPKASPAVPKARSPAKKSRAPSKKPAAEVDPPAKRVKLNSGEPKKLTKKQMREEARARAAAWSERQQSAATSKAARSPAVKTPAKKPALNDATLRSPGKAYMETHDQNDEEVHSEDDEVHSEDDEEEHSEDDEEEEEGKYADAQEQAQDLQEAMDRASQEALERARQDILHYHQTVAAMGGYGNLGMGPPPQGYHMMSPQQQMAHMQAQVPMGSRGQQPFSWTSNPSGNGPFQFSTLHASPPPMNAPAPSTTMRAPPNSFAGAPMPAPKPPALAPVSAGGHRPTMPHPQVHEGEQQHFEQDDEVPEGSKRSGWLGIGVPFLLLSLVVAFAASIAFEDPGKWTSNETTPPSHALPPCFLSNPPEDEEQALGKCDLSKGRVPCPDGGFCSGGELRSCNEVHHEVSEGRDQCVLSTSANVTLAEVEVLVAGWTVEHFCQIQGCSHAIRREGTSTPFFDLSLIQSKVDVSQSLLSMSDAFVLVSGKGGGVVVGFTDAYVKHTLVIPFWCDFAVMLVSFLDWMIRGMMSALQLATGLVLSFTISFPLASAILCLAVWAFYHLDRRRRMRKKLMQDVANVRQLTYEHLMEDVNAEHVVMYLRDEVAMDLFPTSKAERVYIISKVWPRVVSDVKHDNRVRKSSTLVQGTTRDVWQWTASVTPNKKQVSFEGSK